MLPRGHLSGQDDSYKSELLPLSPKRGDLHKKRSQSPTVGQNLHRKLQKSLQGPEDNSLHDLSSVDTTCTKADLTPSGENSRSDCQDGIGVVKDTISGLNEGIRNEEEKEEMEDEEAEQGSSNIVEHILKELKGINKIQEEISDLRQYLTSVRGSVDEVSCCVDAVLSEIGELYSGASAAPHPSPVSQTTHIRRGSLGRQNAITSLQGRDTNPLLDLKDCGKDSGCIPSHRSPKQWQVDRGTLQSDQQTDQENSEQSSCYLGLHRGCDYQSTSSLSSCYSSNCPEAGFLYGDTEYDRWPSVDMQHSVSGEGGWSEEDICSCANSREGGLEDCLDVWDRYATEETQSSTPGHSSHNSSEHLSLLFGHHYNSPSSSSSMVDWRPPRLQTEEENLECDCSANCPYSRSSGYHTMDACANDLGSGPSRSLSCSTVLLTDCDDGYLEPHSLCDDCPSSGDTLDLGSADSLDREWTDHSISRDEAEESLSQESSEIDPESTKTPNVSFDVTTFSKAVLTFRSAVKGALKKLEGSNPEGVKDDSGSVTSPSPVRKASEPKEEQGSTEYTEGEISLTENHTQFGTPKEESDVSVYVDCCETHENLPCSTKASPYEASHSPCTPTEYHSVEISQNKGECSTDGELSNLDLTPDHCPARQRESPLGPVLSTDEVQLSPIRENHVLDEVNQGKPIDASHRERIANFQRILREKRQTHRRLSKSAQGSQGSQGSHGSQGSQGSQSQDEFIPECGGEDNQVTHTTLAPYLSCTYFSCLF
ncbi:uncharacterized protein LOC122865276 [Siniperca chuatsi]|uniref:uncharacterized protein LOC122865276 n=1 Tax=Siniperca chuatsi TaxID=119488 RepID=UPI001CE05115|nr:uncharacterized protein LOC122865276 [Siniperca chuatsi]